MNFWVFSLLTLAGASCYDYEYYDETTNVALPGNACLKQQANLASGQQIGGQPIGQQIGQPFGQPIGQFAQPIGQQIGQPFGQPNGQYVQSTASYSPGLPTYSTDASLGTYVTSPAYSVAAAPSFSSQTYGTTTISAAYPVTTTRLPSQTYGTTAVSTAYQVTSPVTTRLPTATYAPVAVKSSAVVTSQAQARSVAAPNQAQLSAELQYYKDLGERQARRHKQNSRIVKDASKDLSKLSLVNRVVAGAGNAAPWYPALRLGNQKEVAEAYRSEKRIANKNAEDAYQRFQKDPSHLNLLVSKYQDLNADLRDAAYQYNVINAGTFGQTLAVGGLFGGGLGSGLTVSRLITQKQQSGDLEDIQRQMKRVGRQIQAEAQSKISAAKGATSTSQGSVEQRMMGMTVYGRSSTV